MSSSRDDPHTPDDELESPLSETASSPATSPISSPLADGLPAQPEATSTGMTASSTPLGNLNAARKPGPPPSTLARSGTGLPADIAQRMQQFRLGRSGAPPSRTNSSGPSAEQAPTSPHLPSGGIASNLLPGNMSRPTPSHFNSSPAPLPGSKPQSLAQKRGMAPKLGGLPGAQGAPGPAAGGRKRPGFTLSDMNAGSKDSNADSGPPKQQTSAMDKYAEFLDPKTGSLIFKGKATLTNHGVEFSSGKAFNISLDEVETLDELGKGNYGTVYKVRHSRPRMRRPGQGLAGNKIHPSQVNQSPTTATFPDAGEGAVGARGTSGAVMAMKEIRLELDDAKFAAIIMELDILHRCVSPFIVDFFGAFFQDGAVYICMEFMDGGSIDKIYGDGIPESVLRKIALSTTMGLKSLKDEHNIIHRDVKPTNILVNTRGQVKICDFGVSGNLVASIAKTNIGCQSYMAPERISSGGVAAAGANPGGGTYSVQSDIWSLGLSIIECALGRYPYPPETYDNIFSQLSAIVDGEPPDLPEAAFSEAAHDFVHGCLMKIPNKRPTYSMLLAHAWFAPLLKPPTIAEEDEEAAEAGAEMPAITAAESASDAATTEDKEVAAWVAESLERKRNGTMGQKAKPALHAAPLDVVSSPQVEQAVGTSEEPATAAA